MLPFHCQARINLFLLGSSGAANADYEPTAGTPQTGYRLPTPMSHAIEARAVAVYLMAMPRPRHRPFRSHLSIGQREHWVGKPYRLGPSPDFQSGAVSQRRRGSATLAGGSWGGQRPQRLGRPRRTWGPCKPTVVAAGGSRRPCGRGRQRRHIGFWAADREAATPPPRLRQPRMTRRRSPAPGLQRRHIGAGRW